MRISGGSVWAKKQSVKSWSAGEGFEYVLVPVGPDFKDRHAEFKSRKISPCATYFAKQGHIAAFQYRVKRAA
jgi:hypothetical protein